MLESNSQHERKENSKKLTDCTLTGSEADQTQILSLSSKTNNSDVKKKVNPLLVGKEVEQYHLHKTKEQGERRILVSNDSTEPKQFCFQNTGWPSDQLMTGSGCSQWWDFLSYE